MINEIKFIESNSFVGEHRSMQVNGNEHRLDIDMNQTYEQHAVKILKEIYNIDFREEDVKFEWNGTL